MKRVIKVVSGIMMLCLMLMISGMKVKAATPGMTVDLSSNKTYTTSDLDFDGDGRRDNAKIQTVKNGYTFDVYLYVNDRKVYQMPRDSWRSAGMRFLRLQNGRYFIYVWTEGANATVSCHRLLQYKDGHIITIADFDEMLRNFAGGGYVSWYPTRGMSISGNTVSVKYTAMTWTLGAEILHSNLLIPMGH